MITKQNFDGFNGLRFIAITTVILLHLFTFKANFGFTAFDFPALETITYYGVQFFFAGSGFLISYLLLIEYKKNKKISLKDFYLRRIFRLWPGYYLLIILGLVVCLKMPFFDVPDVTDVYLKGNYTQSNLLFFLFLPHIQPYFGLPLPPYVHQTYTIGIEMQFYFLWGLIFFLIPRYTKQLFIGIIAFSIALNFMHNFFYPNWVMMRDSLAVSIFLKAATYIEYSRFSTFALGGIFAYCYLEQRQWLNIFKSIYFQMALYAILILSIFYNFYIPYCKSEYTGLLVLCILAVASYKKDSLINYSSRWLSFLGKISYGIYLFHMFTIVFAAKICVSIFKSGISNYFQLAVLIAITMGLSILFGYVSFISIESFFLNIKKRFEKV